MIRTRFAPSPTGYLHVGGLRTALYAYCVAKKNNGKFVLRIEDTDQKRLVHGAVENLLKTLYWSGIIPDEGVVFDKNNQLSQKGECGGSYIQSERLEIYKEHAKELVNAGKAYYCFCTPERLDEIRELRQLSKLPTGYDGHCRDLDSAEAQKRVENGEKYTIRMKMPKTGETVFNDLVRGEVKIKNELVDDQVIIKSDGFPTYHLAVVVDDHYMGITDIIRGEEWLSSVPKHIKLYEYFGWDVPRMAHLPLILNADKSKLSKRQGDVAVEDYINKGYLKEALINFIAFLGWNPGGERELYLLDELINEFSLQNVGKSGAVFNQQKLDWFNKEYIKRLSDDELLALSKIFFDKAGVGVNADKDKFTGAISLERERITTLAELPQAVAFIFDAPEYNSELLIWKKSTADEVKKILSELNKLLNTISVQSWNQQYLQERVGEWIKDKNYSNGTVLWPLRVALSGQENSPGPFEIAEVLGKNEVLARVNSAINKLP